MIRAVQVFAVIHLGIIGLSHVMAPRAWAEFFAWLRARGEAGVFVVAFMSLGFGSIVAAFHPVWTGIPLALTLLGWAQVLKALIYFLFPAYGLRRLAMATVERAYLFRIGGVPLLVLAGLFAYQLWITRPPLALAD